MAIAQRDLCDNRENSQQSTSDKLDPIEWQLITRSINAYMISEAIYAACELDIFSVIETVDIPSLANIAKNSGLNEYPCSILLMCLCCSQLIRKDPETHLYQNHSAARKAFCKDKNTSFIPFVRFNHHIQQRGMSFFLAALRNNTNAGLSFLSGDANTLYDRLAQANLSGLFHEGMAAYTLFGPKIVKFEAMARCMRLLDIGGGNGSVSRQCLADNPALQSVVMDIEDVCSLGKSLNHDWTNRLQFVSGDIFSSSWRFDQDAILFSHLLEIFSLEKVTFLYQKAYDALPKGGKLFVWTLIANDEETGSLQAAKSSAYFLTMASGEGKTYSKKTHIELSQSIGFSVETVYDRSEYDHLGLTLYKA